MINIYFLEYCLKSKEKTLDDLRKVTGWSPATLARRLKSRANWLVSEVNALGRLGFTIAEIEKIFFDDFVS